MLVRKLRMGFLLSGFLLLLFLTGSLRDDPNGVTLWLMTQSFKRIPLMIRKVPNGRIAFKLKNVEEILSIFDEFVIGLNKEQFMDTLKYVYQGPYDFLFMNMDDPCDKMYHRNFNTLMIDEV